MQRLLVALSLASWSSLQDGVLLATLFYAFPWLISFFWYNLKNARYCLFCLQVSNLEVLPTLTEIWQENGCVLIISILYFIVEPFSDEVGQTADTNFTELTQKEHLNTEISYHAMRPLPWANIRNFTIIYYFMATCFLYRKQFFTQEFT